MNKYDLHVHTVASDGIYTGRQVVDMACSLRLAGIAVTDHDTTNALEDTISYAKGKGLVVLPGIEFSTVCNYKEIHILGYLMDYQSKHLVEVSEYLSEQRGLRAARIIEKLCDLGMPLEGDALVLNAGNVCVGRPHIARALVRDGYVKSVEEAFRLFLDRGMPAYVERVRLSPVEAINIIHDCGGIAVWAHPGAADTDFALPNLLSAGLDGIETVHPKHNFAMRSKYAAIAEAHGLLQTGGSDFHNSGLGEYTVDNEKVLEMFKRQPERI